MLDRQLIEMMYDTSLKSNLEGAQSAAKIYRQMLDMPIGARVTVQFHSGEDFIVTRCQGGYELS